MSDDFDKTEGADDEKEINIKDLCADPNFKRLAGLPKKPRIQRSFWVDGEIWKAAGGLPLSRSEIIYKALLEAVTGYLTELPQLRAEVKELDALIENAQIQRSAKLQRIQELEKADEESSREVSIRSINKQQAATELVRLLEEYGNKMLPLQYQRIAELSGIPGKLIKTFLEETKFLPSNEDLNTFFKL